MKNFKEKVAFLHGLARGLNVEEHSPEGQMLVNIVGALDSLADELHDLNVGQLEVESYVQCIDEDLAELEDDFYEDEDADEDSWVEVECPSCHEVVTFESEILGGDDVVEVTCPHCGETVYESVLDLDDVAEVGDYSIRDTSHPGI